MEAHRPPANPPRLRFSLWTLLAFMTAVAIVAAVFSVLGAPLDSMVYSSIVIGLWPSALLAAVVFGRGARQAFAMGALVPIVLSIAIGFIESPYRSYALLNFVWILSLSGACGAVSVWTRNAVIEGPSE